MTQSAAQIVALPEHRIDIRDAYLRGLPSKSTKAVYAQALRAFDGFQGGDILNCTRRDIEAYRSHLEALGRAPATIAKVMSAINGFLIYAVDEGILDKNPAARARRPKAPTTSTRRGLSSAEVQSMIAACDTSTVIGLRDRALVIALAVQGWRVGEALRLRVEDMDEEQGHKVATINGKGAKVSRVPLAAMTWAAITAFASAATITTGPVFVPVLKGGRVRRGAAMTARSAWKRVGVIAIRAGIARTVHPHLFRHGAASTALAAGVPLHKVQDHLRHADPRTTRRYDSHRASLANETSHVLAGLLAFPEGG